MTYVPPSLLMCNMYYEYINTTTYIFDLKYDYSNIIIVSKSC